MIGSRFISLDEHKQLFKGPHKLRYTVRTGSLQQTENGLEYVADKVEDACCVGCKDGHGCEG